jgi:hypothetical protein
MLRREYMPCFRIFADQLRFQIGDKGLSMGHHRAPARPWRRRMSARQISDNDDKEALI